MMIKRAHKSGCNKTKREGTPTIQTKGIKPSEVWESIFLYLLQNADTESTMVSLRSSVGWREKGIPGISNHPRAPLIFTPKTSTSISKNIVIIVIHFICFFHHR